MKEKKKSNLDNKERINTIRSISLSRLNLPRKLLTKKTSTTFLLKNEKLRKFIITSETLLKHLTERVSINLTEPGQSQPSIYRLTA